jgi:hypothetical protein
MSSASSEDELKNCQKILDQVTATPGLYAAILDCELAEESDAFATDSDEYIDALLAITSFNDQSNLGGGLEEAVGCSGSGRCDNVQGGFSLD